MINGPENSMFSRPRKIAETENFNAKQVLQKAQRQLYASALQSPEGIQGLREWRSFGQKGKSSRAALRLFETLSAYNQAKHLSPGQEENLCQAVMESMKLESSQTSRVTELLSCCQVKELGGTPPPVRPEVQRIFDRILNSKSSEGEVDVPELLSSNHFSFGSKAKWFESRLSAALDFLEQRDLEEARQEAEKPLPPELLEQKEQQPDINVPPPRENDLQPSMEEMESAKENEPGAYFKIAPFYGGYYRGNDFDSWNTKSMKWEKSSERLSLAVNTDLDPKSRRVVSGTIRPGAATELPMPYGFAPDIRSLKTHGDANLQIKTDSHGDFVLVAPSSESLITFSVEIGKGGELLRETEPKDPAVKPTALKFGSAGAQACLEISQSSSSVLDKARALKAYVRTTLKYSNDSSFNQVYRSGPPENYFQRIEKHTQADCDVANTYFVALLSSINIKARLVSGHYVSSKDKNNAAVISSGTGHAWAEVWDGHGWHRLDATPPGDPNMDEDETDEETSDAAFEGDFGEKESSILSDEELEKLIEEASKALAEKEKAPEEKRALQFAAEASCSPEEAKRVLQRITEAREKRDNQGRLIRSRLLAEWKKIIQDNLLKKPRYTAQIRLSRGEELVDPVEASLDMKAGDADPTGFSRYEHTVEREQVYGGFDSFLVVDKSGSMDESDSQSGRSKWEEQQLFTFLLMDSMYSAAQEFKREKIKLISPLDLRVALVSFSAGGAKVELPLGTVWGPKEQLKVWKALQENVGGGTPDHLGLQAVKQLIENDNAENKAGKERLRLVLISADGGSDSVSKTISAKEDLKSTGAVVKAAGIGSGAREVVATYTPDGANLSSFAEAPDWAATEVLAQAQRLYPKKVKNKA